MQCVLLLLKVSGTVQAQEHCPQLQSLASILLVLETEDTGTKSGLGGQYVFMYVC